MLNVAAGVFLTSYFGPGEDIKLELPQYLFFSEAPRGRCSPKRPPTPRASPSARSCGRSATGTDSTSLEEMTPC